MEFFDFIKQLVDPQGLNQLVLRFDTWIYLILFLVVFCETGLVVTPFLPGDSMLFAIGAVAAIDGSPLSMTLLASLLIVAAVAGDAINYSIGHYLGPKVFRYEDSWLLNKKHLLRAQHFYEKWGGRAIFLARFFPILRTFAPFVAGIGAMRYPRFFVYNVTGGVVWVLSFLLLGYYFGRRPWVQQNFQLVIVAIIVLSVLPIVIEFIRAWKHPEKRDLPVPAEQQV